MFGSDPSSKVLFISCFSGMHDNLKIYKVLANAINLNVTNKKPIVVRMRGLGSKDANEQLQQLKETHNLGDELHIIKDFDEACEMAVKLSLK